MREMTRRMTKVERRLDEHSHPERHLRMADVTLRVMWTQARNESCQTDVEAFESLYGRLRAGEFFDLQATLRAIPQSMKWRLDAIMEAVTSIDIANTSRDS